MNYVDNFLRLLHNSQTLTLISRTILTCSVIKFIVGLQ